MQKQSDLPTTLDYTDDLTLTELPEGLVVMRLIVKGCWNLKRLPRGLCAFSIHASDSGIEELPDDIQVENCLDLSGCVNLTDLPVNLKVGTLVLAGCTRLTALPEGLQTDFLNITDCVALQGWPQQAQIGVGRLIARGCAWVTELPPYLTRIAQLDLTDCAKITALPENLEVTSWLDLTGTGITELPESLRHVRLRWRGVVVNEQIVFRPETLVGTDVLETRNAEVRRVMLERMGVERFLTDIQPKVLDTDRDPGGVRKLLRVTMPGDEDLVCLSVCCPSTQRPYLLRVPPTIQRCHQAAAWIAGFDDARAYAPLAET
jgi:hypothetical protein